MIVDALDNLELYFPEVPKLQVVTEVMDKGDVYDKPDGSYQTKDPKVRYLISSYETSSGEKPYEIHRRSTDVLVILQGTELVSETWREAAKDADAPYDKEADVQYTTGEPVCVCKAGEGRFFVFLPGEPYRTGVSIGLPAKNKRVLFKIYD